MPPNLLFEWETRDGVDVCLKTGYACFIVCRGIAYFYFKCVLQQHYGPMNSVFYSFHISAIDKRLNIIRVSDKRDNTADQGGQIDVFLSCQKWNARKWTLLPYQQEQNENVLKK